jgi:hypothetical protein
LWTSNFPLFRPFRVRSGGIAEVTRLNCEGQFKPFVYLNWRTGLPVASGGAICAGTRPRTRPKKNPALRRDFPALAWFTFELAILWRILALTARILLLLAGLLTAALLLAGLLVRILVLLARIWVLVRHRRSPLLNVVQNNRKARHWFQRDAGSAVMIAW